MIVRGELGIYVSGLYQLGVEWEGFESCNGNLNWLVSHSKLHSFIFSFKFEVVKLIIK